MGLDNLVFSSSDLFFLAVILCGGIFYALKSVSLGSGSGTIDDCREGGNGRSTVAVTVDKNDISVPNRSIIKTMADLSKNCVVFFGSQTGNAEDYAARLAKEGSARFSLQTMAADMADYDCKDLKCFPEDHIMIFVLATYGEGEPTDNAVSFYEYVTGAAHEPDDPKSLPFSNLTYAAFGLGNTSYVHYNAVVRTFTTALGKLGARRICAVGEGDDGQGTIEEDFIAWKEALWSAVAAAMNLEERKASYEPVFSIKPSSHLTAKSPSVYLGELTEEHLKATPGPHGINRPYISAVVESRELFNTPDRNCIHMDLDISTSGFSYKTGDHVAIWPMNSNTEVDLFLHATGLTNRHEVITVEAFDGNSKVPIPSPTTYDSIVRYYLEICATVSRQFISLLIPFSPDDDSRSQMTRLADDKNCFAETVTEKYLNIAQLLTIVGGGKSWDEVPFSIFLEGLHKLQPRYYSISSSSLSQPQRISITVVVESRALASRTELWKGVATNYLLSVKKGQSGQDISAYDIGGPRGKYTGSRIPLHIRTSNFRMPSDSSKPIIMVGSGTGVAPFRGFIQERVAQVASGANVGKALLFYGCRNRAEDFMYSEEWETYKAVLGNRLEIVMVFSRDGPRKIYVQDRLLDFASTINELLQHSGQFYVCGDAANMARAVGVSLGHLLAQERGLSAEEGHSLVKKMRSNHLYQEDTW